MKRIIFLLSVMLIVSLDSTAQKTTFYFSTKEKLFSFIDDIGIDECNKTEFGFNSENLSLLENDTSVKIVYGGSFSRIVFMREKILLPGTYFERNGISFVVKDTIMKKCEYIFRQTEASISKTKFYYLSNYVDKTDYVKDKIQIDIQRTNFIISKHNFELTKSALNSSHRIASLTIQALSSLIFAGMVSNPNNIQSAYAVLGIGTGVSFLTYLIGEIRVNNIRLEIKPIIDTYNK